MTSQFVHLHLHTEYSLVDSTIRVKSLIKTVAEAGMPALAVTDQCNLFSMVKFYRAALQHGVKPIIGVDAWIHNAEQPSQPYRTVFLCMNNAGYQNLTQLVSMSFTQGQHSGVPVIQLEWLDGKTDGLIALSGGAQGPVGRQLLSGNAKAAGETLEQWLAWFPDRYYLELQRVGRPQENDYLQAAVQLALQTGTPVVATNDVQFLKATDFEAHEARVCIHEGRTLDDPRRPKRYTPQQYLRSAQEMAELFSDIPEALENTVEIAKRCNVELTLGKNFLPDFPIPDGMSEAEYFRRQASEGLERRLPVLFDVNASDYPATRQRYFERLNIELDVIINMGFPGYFLIVADFIQWAKNNGVPVGPGRGSGAGSLVAYALTITDLDPIKYELLFERFLNPERVSMPDFDVDFCMEGRDRVIDYVAQHYGRDKVSQIITYGSMAAKAVVRDVGRVMGHPYGFVDQIAKLIPFEVGMTLEKALEQEAALRERYEKEEDVQSLINMALSLEGLARNAGKHAGGVVIAPSKLTDFAPLYCEPGGAGLVTQFDKDDVEAVGLVKFDFLGLRTLTIIDWALQTINAERRRQGAEPIDINTIPLDDPATYSLLKQNATTAVFQLESRGMKDLIKRLQPDRFEDIVALVALFRPGPLQSGMVDDFINRKHGRAKVEYPHPALEPILRPTYGVILYQEQVMQIAQVLAGYTLGGADLLRRAMGKKKPEEMAKQREIFTQGATERGVAAQTATYIFDLMEKFAGYGFNKSHSAAYALVSYQTAWLKAHFPAAFMAAVLSADMDNTDKVVTLIEECRAMNLEVVPPNVNYCEYRFTVKDNKTIYYGLGAIKGVGEGAIESIRENHKAQACISHQQSTAAADASDLTGRSPSSRLDVVSATPSPSSGPSAPSDRRLGALATIADEKCRLGDYRDLFDFCERVDLKKLNRRTLEALIRSGTLDSLGPNRATLMGNLTTALQQAEQHSRDSAAGQSDLFGIGEVAQVKTVQYEQVSEWSDEIRLSGEKETLGLYLTGHPIDRYVEELRGIITSKIADLNPTSNKTIIVAGLVVAIRTMNTRRGDKMAFVTIDDRSGRVELAVFSDAFAQYRDVLAKDRLVIVEGEVSVDDYTGGVKMSAQKIYDINRAREVFAKRLMLTVDYSKAANGFASSLMQILDPYKQGHCPVYIEYRGEVAKARLRLGKEWQVHPTDELIHRLHELAGKERVKVEYS